MKMWTMRKQNKKFQTAVIQLKNESSSDMLSKTLMEHTGT